jgi:dolichol-phosphate mannosyltransferase
MTPPDDASVAAPTSAVQSPPVELSITIAAYREAENLAVMLPLIKAAAEALTPRYEVLIVDTEQPMDNTAEICAANGVRHVHRSGGNSYGDAIRTIIAEARGAYLLNMDGDGSHSPDYFAAMWAEREPYDIVIGSRYAKGGHTENPAILVFMSYVLNLTFRIAFSIRAKDVTNSFRLYRRDVLTPLRLESNDFDVLEEVLIKATLRNPPARIGEVPVTFGRRKAGESKRKLAQFAFGYMKTLQRMRSFATAARREAALAANQENSAR